MYNVRFWYMSKKDNSTYAPNINDVDPIECDLMDDSGLLAPTLQLNYEAANTDWNYCYIDAFKRFYFVNNWRYSLGLWICELQIDVLASWRNEIFDQNLYILRSAGSSNPDIRDEAYPLLSGTGAQLKSTTLNPWNTDYDDGYFLAGIVNADTNTVGAISYYVFDAGGFRNLLSALLGNVSFYNVYDISTDLTKLLANPFQYIVSCRWMPMPPPAGTAVTTVPLGWWSFNVAGLRLDASTIVEQAGYRLDIPKHPQISRGNYLEDEPYSSYYLIAAPFGSFSLPADRLNGRNQIELAWSIDYITGIGALYITADGLFVNRIEGKIGAEIALAQMAPNFETIGNAVFSQAVPQLSGNVGTANVLTTKFNELINGGSDFQHAITNTISGVANAFLSSLCPAQISGTNGGVSGSRFDIELIGQFKYIAPESYAEKGRPLCENELLANLHGFVQCGEVDINIPCTKPETDAIKIHLAQGLFLE